MSDRESSEEVSLERAIEILLAQVDNLDERVSRIESFVASTSQRVASPIQASAVEDRNAQMRPRRYRADPFHGLFGYYFVLGVLLLACLGVVLALTNRESITLVWWVSAAILTLYQITFVVLGAIQKDRHTLMNATVGLALALLIDIGVIRLLPFPSLFSP